MAQYIERLNDGTERVVRYNPHHDGPVTERLTAIKRMMWLSKYCKRHPGNLQKRLELKRLSSQIQLSSSKHRNATSNNPSVGKRRHGQRLSLRSDRRPNRPYPGPRSPLQTQQPPGLTTEINPPPGICESEAKVSPSCLHRPPPASAPNGEPQQACRG